MPYHRNFLLTALLACLVGGTLTLQANRPGEQSEPSQPPSLAEEHYVVLRFADHPFFFYLVGEQLGTAAAPARIRIHGLESPPAAYHYENKYCIRFPDFNQGLLQPGSSPITLARGTGAFRPPLGEFTVPTPMDLIEDGDAQNPQIHGYNNLICKAFNLRLPKAPTPAHHGAGVGVPPAATLTAANAPRDFQQPHEQEAAALPRPSMFLAEAQGPGFGLVSAAPSSRQVIASWPDVASGSAPAASPSTHPVFSAESRASAANHPVQRPENRMADDDEPHIGPLDEDSEAGPAAQQASTLLHAPRHKHTTWTSAQKKAILFAWADEHIMDIYCGGKELDTLVLATKSTKGKVEQWLFNFRRLHMKERAKAKGLIAEKDISGRMTVRVDPNAQAILASSGSDAETEKNETHPRAG